MSGSETSDARERLRTQVQYLKGVGPSRAERLSQLGIRTAADLLFHFPRDYEELGAVCRVDELLEGQPATLLGEIVEVDARQSAKGQPIVSALVRCDQQHLRAVWFNQPFVRRQLRLDMRVLVTGSPRLRGLSWEMIHPKIRELKTDEPPPPGQLLPVYGLTQGIKQSQMRRIVQQTVEQFAGVLEDVFPESFRQANELMGIVEAIEQIHIPTSADRLNLARQRLVYQELLVLQLALAMRRQRLSQHETSPVIEVDAKLDARIRARYPFDLTRGQREAVEQIRADLCRPMPMNRLLQGDVGSGKTAVAFYALLATIANGYQAVIMSPTEILTQQHFKNLQRLLMGSRVKIGLLSGGMTRGNRQQLLDELATGELEIVFGTHAVIQQDVRFKRLGLVVVDEQHKFGVKQRYQLREAGDAPHYLVMTATPIPRSLSMTMFGDLDVSTIRELPPGRRRVHTYIGQSAEREKWWEFFRGKLREGRQGYVITPLVDESNDESLASVHDVFESLANDQLSDFRIDLLHGRLSNDEKREAMLRFSSGESQVIVATSVVEVGVDVANATVMTIESADRFGLAQLHQLRGRVSRGKFDGFVCAFPSKEESNESPRLQAFAATNDGFQLAEMDFSMRGPGNLLGTRQHGMPPLRIADLVRDREVLERARQDAKSMIEQDDELAEPSFAGLRKMVINRYGRVLDLGDVG